jgi:myosin heavy subunit
MESEEIKPRNIMTVADKDDLIDLPFLNEPEILLNLKNRFEQSKIFTNAGPILITINPFDEVVPTESCITVARKFVDDIKLAGVNNHLTNGTKMNFSILISGESGSGKTESFKLLLNLIGKQATAQVTSQPSSPVPPGHQRPVSVVSQSRQEWLGRSLLATKALESFGNAMTMHTVNSSRFGKLVEVGLNSVGEMIGMNTRTYLLESSRTTNQQLRERNFNIFYQLLAGSSPQEKEQWKLPYDASRYHYTNQGQLSNDEESNLAWTKIDAENFHGLKIDLLKIGLGLPSIDELFEAIVAIVHMGEIPYEDKNDLSGGSNIVKDQNNPDMDPLRLASHFLGISSEQLEELTTLRSFVSRGERIIRPLNTAQAKIARDAIAKAIYRGLFDYLVFTFNERMKKTEGSASVSSLLLVDIFGFDSFAYNSMDQLCINYANEVLQQLFNFNVFKKEIALYQEQGINYDDLKFSDNQANIELIANGLFRVLDDQCRLPDPTDKRFVAQLYKDFNSNKLFSATPAQQLVSKFSLQHFSGPVEYTVDDFIMKNSDNLPTDTGKILLGSRNSILKSIAAGEYQGTGGVKRRSSLVAETHEAGNQKTSGRSSTTAPSFVAQVKSDLHLLLKEVEGSELHYVRCLKPFSPERNWQFNQHSFLNNRDSFPKNRKIKFSNLKITEQLRYGGVLEAIKITRTKFRSYLTYTDFYARYRMVVLNLGDAVSFNGPKVLPSSTPLETAKKEVKKMIDTIVNARLESYESPPASNTSSRGNGFGSSTPTSPNKNSKASPTFSPVGSPNKQLKQKLSKQISRREMSTALTNKNAFFTGVILEPSKIQLGSTLVFLKVKEYEILEALRNASIVAHVVVMQTIFRRVYWQEKYKKMKTALHLMLRVYRGFRARLLVKRLRLLRKAVVWLQHAYRAKRFLRKARKIQIAYRSYRAKNTLQSLKRRHHTLMAIYGPLITARELRMQRRRSFTGLPNDLTNGVAIIPPLEIRFQHYAKEEIELVGNIMKLVSQSKLDEEQLKGELEFDKLVREIALQVNTLPNDNFKAFCIDNLKDFRLAEHILKLRKLTDNTFLGKMVGSSMWKSLNKYAGDIQKVVLTPTHPLFLRINECISVISLLKARCQEEYDDLERQRQKTRTGNVSGARHAATGDIDLMIATFTNQLKAAKKLQTLFEILEKYYKNFLSNFMDEYGPDSPFRKNYDSEKHYLKALIEVVNAAKKYVPIPASTLAQKQNIYRVGNCPLKVDWRENLELPKVDLTPYHQIIESSSNKKESAENDIVKIILSLELKKRDFNADNLRILEFNDIGYQFLPYDPAINFAMNAFNELLCGHEITARRLVKLAGTRQLAGKVTFYQAMNHLSRTSLMDVLYNPVHVEQLNSFSFSMSVISCCVLGLLNLQPNHVMVKYQNKDLPNQSIRISGFNPDAILSAQFLDYANPSRYVIHQRNMNVLFFLPQMDEPVDPDLRAFLTSSPFVVEEIITSWLRDLYDQNRRYAALKTAGVTPEDFTQLHVPLLLPAGATIEMRRRLNRICRLLRTTTAEREGHVATSYVTVSQIVETLFPPIGEYYLNARHSSDFTENAEDVDGVVSYAYMYHQALDSEKRGKNQGKSTATRKVSVGGIFRKSFIGKPEDERGDSGGGGGDSGVGQESDDDSSIDFGSESSIGPGNVSLRSIDRQPSTAFSYDQVYLESNTGIPGVDDDEQEELGMNVATKDTFDEQGEKILRVEDPRGRSNTSEFGDAPIDSSRLYKLVPDTSAFQFDKIYEKGGSTAQEMLNAGGSHDDGENFVQYPPIPFQMIQKKITMRLSTPITGTAAAAIFDYRQIYNNNSDDRSSEASSAISAQQNPAIKHETPVKGVPKMPLVNQTPPLRAGIADMSAPGSKKSNVASAQKTPNYDDNEDNSSYLSYAAGGYDDYNNRPVSKDMKGGSSPAIKFEGPPEEFRKKVKKSVVKYDAELVGDEQRRTPLIRTIEEEGFEFFNSLDWRDFAQLRPFGQAEEFCEMIGRNLTFLTSVWLNHINDWQFKALFRYWVRSNINRALVLPGMKAVTREVFLRYSKKEDMINMQNCSFLSKLLKKFNIDLKFAVLSDGSNPESELPAVEEPTKTGRKKHFKPIVANPDQYDIYKFTPDDVPLPPALDVLLSQSMDGQDSPLGDIRTIPPVGRSNSNINVRLERASSLEESEFLNEFTTDLTPAQEITVRKLNHALWACLNKIKMAELETLDDHIQNVRTIIHILAKDQPITLITKTLLHSFTRLLVEYPILTPIAMMLAERKGFMIDLTIMHQLISSKYVEKYLDIIFSILYNHPEALVKLDPEGLLPCDRIKKISNPRLRNFKYTLLAKFINFLSGPFTRSFQSIHKGIFSHYRGDEEMIVMASLYDFSATESELKLKRFELTKKDDSTHSMYFLLKLLLVERDALITQTAERDNVWKCYKLLIKTLMKRITKSEISLKDCEEYLWKGVDLSLIPNNIIKEKKISMKEIESSSRIYRDLSANWSSLSKVRQSFKNRKHSSTNNPLKKQSMASMSGDRSIQASSSDDQHGLRIPGLATGRSSTGKSVFFQENSTNDKEDERKTNSPMKSILSNPSMGKNPMKK